MRSSRMERAPDYQSKRCNSPGFHFASSDTVTVESEGGIYTVALLNKVNKNKAKNT
jgi:hypothetical protein